MKPAEKEVLSMRTRSGPRLAVVVIATRVAG
jgi:hypothetical protein